MTGTFIYDNKGEVTMYSTVTSNYEQVGHIDLVIDTDGRLVWYGNSRINTVDIRFNYESRNAGIVFNVS